ncbi:methyl-accepting chemotaxis sensory transducer [Ruminiclostridium papyrosolvens DSM 2782]|uniref:Methyl-accepting chemotaxis sensory transducer n=1 Tax=Ruminiclostridium papyrosolvens DSM 2782 TaxID=588581 RepID=F1TCL3_9FIRM|nr:methyl-accepting chemotaxis protein [Ruminiclostridium papyrosolvens]EGD47730.1 methyl-accepting chemotaxis sensory transducer [Ruminiclostridium papyrosolvens DSM 2782]WES34447.1 methyl-accepting chemotaxis protein [Ruminiclostridium papyrosolvens DSM 2782]
MFKLMDNAKIRVKLVVLIFAMIVGMVLVGSIGWLQTRKAQSALDTMYNDNLSQVASLSNAGTAIMADFANILRLIASDNTSYQMAVLSDIIEKEKNLDNSIKKISTKNLGSEGAKIHTSINGNLTAWKEIKNKIIELSTSGKTPEASALYSDKGDTIFRKLESNVTGLINANIKEASDVYKESLKSAKQASLFLIILIIAVSLVCVLVGIVIARSITRPITTIVGIIKKIAGFDLVFDETHNSLIKRRDEIGIIINSVSDMRHSLHNTITKLHNISGTMAANSEELTTSTAESTKSITQVTASLDEIAKGNANQSEVVSKTSEHITEIAGHISKANYATTENEKAVILSLEAVSEGYNAVVLTSEKVQENISVSEEVNRSLSDLSKSVIKVGSITDVINSLAAQTNLLALNAAIEAARAGTAGKGFAVVADEVRKLAEESSSAAKEINAIIQAIIANNAMTAHNMERAKELEAEQSFAVETTKHAFDKIRISVEAIADKTKEVSEMLATIDKASREISSHTHDLATLAEESAASSEEISASSQQQLSSMEIISKASSDLSDMAQELDNEINKFKL